MSAIRFTKMHGIGNDYVYVDGSAERVPDPPALARAISDRHEGVGADGLILIVPPEPGVEADVRMRMYNADGSESEMCGNGVRCVCKYAHDHGLARANPMRVQTGAGVLVLEYRVGEDSKVDEVTVDMGEPITEARRIPVRLDGDPGGVIVDVDLRPYLPAGTAPAGVDLRATCVSMGNPHAVFYTDRLDEIPLDGLGPILETLAIFPRRMNVHFVDVRSTDEITMRTWERGSGVTRACGTGAAAVCVAGVLIGRTDRAILAHLPGGDLRLRWLEDTGHVFKTGPAVEVFSGVWAAEPPRRRAAPRSAEAGR